LKKVNKIITMRRKNARYLTKKLSKVKEVMLPAAPDDYFQVYQMYTIRVRGGKGVRDDLVRYLAERGIMTKVFFYPVHLTHFYRNELGYRTKLPVTEKVSGEVLTLPMYPSLTKGEMDYIADTINAFFEVGE